MLLNEMQFEANEDADADADADADCDMMGEHGQFCFVWQYE